MTTYHIMRTSGWTFNTSGTGGLGLGLAAASGGEIVLNPPSGPPKGFYYGAGGMGLSVGVRKIPKIGRIVDRHGLSNKGGSNVAPKSFSNGGAVFIMNGFRKPGELGVEDFRGVCCVVDVGAGVLAGFAGSLLLVNVNPLALAAFASPALAMFGPPLDPKAMVLMGGLNVGLQASAGVAGEIGYLWPKAGAA